MFRLLFVVLSVVYTVNVFAQDKVADSLEVLLKKADSDTLRAKRNMQLAYHYKEKDIAKAKEYANNGLRIAVQSKDSYFIGEGHECLGMMHQAASEYPEALKSYNESLNSFGKAKDSSGIAEAMNNIGIIYYFTAEYQKAQEYLTKSGELKVRSHDTIGAARAFNNSGIMLDILGQPSKALEIYIKALKLYEKAGKKQLQIGTLQNIGLIQINQKNYDDALKYYNRGIALSLEVKDDYTLAKGYNSLGIIYDKRQEFDKALDYYTKALDLNRKIGDKPGIAQALNNIAINQTFRGDYDNAIATYREALVLKEELGNKSSIAFSQLGLGEAYEQKKDYKSAISYFEKALANARLTGYKQIIKDASKNLSRTYAETGNFQHAYEALTEHVIIADSLLSEENSKIMEEMKSKYDSEKKEAQIALLNKENLLSAEKLEKSREREKRQNLQIYSLAGGLTLLLILVFIVYRNNMEKKKSNQMLQKQNNFISEQKNIIEEKNREIVDSITYAKRLQHAIIPPVRILHDHFPEAFVLYKPKDIVAGDFYWFHHCQNDKGEKISLLAVVDCTGHGVPGALVSMVGFNGLNQCVNELKLTKPGSILDNLNVIVRKTFSSYNSEAIEKSDEVKDGMDISIMAVNHTRQSLEWSGANNPLWIVRNEDLIELKGDKQPIGYFADTKAFTTHDIELKKGDLCYLFTDGYADQFGGEKGKKFKYRQLQELLMENRNLQLDRQQKVLDQRFETWRGVLEQVDDVCLVGVKI